MDHACCSVVDPVLEKVDVVESPALQIRAGQPLLLVASVACPASAAAAAAAAASCRGCQLSASHAMLQGHLLQHAGHRNGPVLPSCGYGCLAALRRPIAAVKGRHAS